MVNIKGKKISKLLYIFLALLIIGGIFAAVLLLRNTPNKEEPAVAATQIEEEATMLTEPSEETESAEEPDEEWMETYNLICEYMDQGDAKAAINALLEDPAAEAVYARLNAEDAVLLEDVLVDAACFYNEDGQLYQITDLRLKDFFTDALFVRYWERIGTEIPAAIADDAKQSAYDVYLFHELLNWYERGERAIAEIVNLRYLGMIDNVLYGALVDQWQIDPMDDVDSGIYIPHYGMTLTADEKEQIRSWQIYVDEGESREAAQMLLQGEKTKSVYHWLRKNDANLVDMVLAQAMFELAEEGAYEENIRLILGGFVSDTCFERYWELLAFTPAENERTREDYESTDLYFVCEIQRICTLTNAPSLVQKLRDDGLIDDNTYDLLLDRVGGWEISDSET